MALIVGDTQGILHWQLRPHPLLLNNTIIILISNIIIELNNIRTIPA